MSHASCLTPLPPLLFCCWFYEAQKCWVLGSWRLHVMSRPCGYLSICFWKWEWGSCKQSLLPVDSLGIFPLISYNIVFDAFIQMFLLPVSLYSSLFHRIVHSMFLLTCTFEIHYKCLTLSFLPYTDSAFSLKHSNQLYREEPTAQPHFILKNEQMWSLVNFRVSL